jgi:hypothetical protein
VSVGVAVLAHALILALALLVYISRATRSVPTIQVVGDGNPEQVVNKQQFQQRVTRKPSAASSKPIQTVIASATDPIAVPVEERLVDDPLDFGVAGVGDGLGFGSAGLGMGGASFLGLKGGGKSVVLVIDTSSSMPGNCGPEGIAAIRREIEKTVNALSPASRFNLVCYSNDADLFKPEPVPASPENKAAAIEFMKGYFGAGPWTRTRTEQFGNKGTDPLGIAYTSVLPQDVKGLEGTSGSSRIELGLLVALQMEPSSVFVLSDGSPNTTRNNRLVSHANLISIVRDRHDEIFQRGDAPVTIGTISIKGEGEKFLKDIAREFKGKHKDIKPDEL